MINDPASPERNNDAPAHANRLAIEPAVAVAAGNGTEGPHVAPGSTTTPIGVPLSLPDLVKLLGASWKTVILAVASSDGPDAAVMCLKHGSKAEAAQLANALGGVIQNGA